MANLNGETQITILSRVYVPVAQLDNQRHHIFQVANLVNAAGVYMRCGTGSTNEWQAVHWDGTNGDLLALPAPTVSGWYEVASVFNFVAGTIGLYVDGAYTQVAASYMPSSLGEASPAGKMYIGRGNQGAAYRTWFNGGEIQFVKVIDTAMSQAEIDTFYSTGEHPGTMLHKWDFRDVAAGAFPDGSTVPAAVQLSAATIKPQIANMRPVLYWPLTETIGQGVKDALVSGGHGSLQGGALLSSDGVVLDGVDDWIKLTQANLFPTYSVYLEVFPDSIADDQALYGQHSVTGANHELLQIWTGEVRPVVAGANPASYPVPSSFFNVGEWNQVLMTVDASDGPNTTYTLYINDTVAVDSQTVAATVSAHDGLEWVLGQEYDSGPVASGFLDGTVRHFALFDRIPYPFEIDNLLPTNLPFWDRTFNAAFSYSGATLTDETASDGIQNAISDVSVTSGKVYFEFEVLNIGAGSNVVAGGFYKPGEGATNNFTIRSTLQTAGYSTPGDVVHFAYDFDTDKFWLGCNGTWYNSGDPAAGTGELFTAAATEVFAAIQSNNSTNLSGNLRLRESEFTLTLPAGFRGVGDPVTSQYDPDFHNTDYLTRGPENTVTRSALESLSTAAVARSLGVSTHDRLYVEFTWNYTSHYNHIRAGFGNDGVGVTGLPAAPDGGVLTGAAVEITAPGDVGMLAVDLWSNKIWTGVNGVWRSGTDPANRSSGAYTSYSNEGPTHAIVAMYTSGDSAVMAANSKDFAYAPPFGFLGVEDEIPAAVWDDSFNVNYYWNALGNKLLRGTLNTGNYSNARTVSSASTGKLYFEFQNIVTAAQATGMFFGVIDALDNESTNFILFGNAFQAGAADGSTVMVAVDLDNGLLWVGADGVWSGDPAAGTGNIATHAVGTGHIAARWNTSTQYAELATDTADLDYAAPVGFAPWGDPSNVTTGPVFDSSWSVNAARFNVTGGTIDRTATDTGLYTAIRSVEAKNISAAKLYFEVVITDDGGQPLSSNIQYGITDPTTANTVTGTQNTAQTYYTHYDNYWINFEVGDVLQFAVDGATGDFWLGVNDAWRNGGTGPDGTTAKVGTLSVIDLTQIHLLATQRYAGQSMTFRTKASEMTYGVPTGFSAWDDL